VAENTGTVVLTHDQPQSSGNTKPTGVTNLSLRTNNGTGGGTSNASASGVVSDPPSF
jgi:hypothetical protein